VIYCSAQTTVEQRRLNDGRTFQIVKVYYDPENFTRRLEELGWDVQICATPSYFLYGAGAQVGAPG
jgi:hypothetical protein